MNPARNKSQTKSSAGTKFNLNLDGVKHLATKLARQYRTRDAAIGLVGPLGAGKTAFAKEFAKFFGVKKVKSPTFMVSARYEIGKRTLFHFDLYRIDNPGKLKALDLEEILASKNRIVLIEWADKFPKLHPKLNLLLKFEVTGKNLRHVTLHKKL
ncbi:MAG TPA: tRNA (adenosine(37)-N6)-threonylcarbamoyltransferase complex ATPase subunit type 1 TsaE [Patescibacteria group bacterium]|nr:tRNA (adenosine(37)-N6)-threonylcarbamoyltransferase complex ATPase subunit type 1 TsaE [Patescibacteria group bacterium]